MHEVSNWQKDCNLSEVQDDSNLEINKKQPKSSLIVMNKPTSQNNLNSHSISERWKFQRYKKYKEIQFHALHGKSCKLENKIQQNRTKKKKGLLTKEEEDGEEGRGGKE